MTQIPDSLKKLRDEKADEALVNAIEGGGFIEKPYSRYRFHNGYIAGFDAACAELLPVIEEMRDALESIIGDGTYAVNPEDLKEMRGYGIGNYIVAKKALLKAEEICR